MKVEGGRYLKARTHPLKRERDQQQEGILLLIEGK